MEVAYTAKATSDITCIAETDAAQWASDALPETGGEVTDEELDQLERFFLSLA